MNPRAEIARKYFDAFHAGRIDEVTRYFAAHGTVQFGKEPEKRAADFFVETKDLIATVRFRTLGVYASETTGDILIHFTFAMPDEAGRCAEAQAVDVITFDDANRIEHVKVITNP